MLAVIFTWSTILCFIQVTKALTISPTEMMTSAATSSINDDTYSLFPVDPSDGQFQTSSSKNAFVDSSTMISSSTIASDDGMDLSTFKLEPSSTNIKDMITSYLPTPGSANSDLVDISLSTAVYLEPSSSVQIIDEMSTTPGLDNSDMIPSTEIVASNSIYNIDYSTFASIDETETVQVSSTLEMSPEFQTSSHTVSLPPLSVFYSEMTISTTISDQPQPTSDDFSEMKVSTTSLLSNTMPITIIPSSYIIDDTPMSSEQFTPTFSMPTIKPTSSSPTIEPTSAVSSTTPAMVISSQSSEDEAIEESTTKDNSALAAGIIIPTLIVLCILAGYLIYQRSKRPSGNYLTLDDHDFGIRSSQYDREL